MVAEVPVVAGEASEIQLEIRNRRKAALKGELQVQAAEAIGIEPTVSKYEIGAGETRIIRFRVTMPASTRSDVELIATSIAGDASATAIAKVHPIPSTTIARLKAPPAMEGGDGGWTDVRAIEIPPTNVAEGRVKDAADSSARFRLAHDGSTLFVDVEVNDDVVVSNIAPNDIRGHWRSDSIEICVDPDGGAEHTLGCFKVGIFPFDTTGHVRAARDADANQGPIEETAPGMKLASFRTPSGYRIQARIPFRAMGIAYRPGKRIGFNVIIYDGDKVGAAVGENINKSRIAWSPRAGVQGRPEDWGRVVLE